MQLSEYYRLAEQIHGYPPPENPFAQQRLYQDFTFKDLSHYLNVSEQTIYKLINGSLPSIPQVLAEWFYDSLNEDPGELYDAFKTHARQYAHRLFGPTFTLAINSIAASVVPSPLSPLSRLYEQWHLPDGTPIADPLNDYKLSRLLCVNQSSLSMYRNGRTRSFPSALMFALKQNGYALSPTTLYNKRAAGKAPASAGTHLPSSLST